MLFSKLSATAVLALAALVNASTSFVNVNQGQLIPGKYIVALKSSVSDQTLKELTSRLESDSDINIEAIYNINDSFKGFSAEMTEAEMNKLKAHPDVDMIEQDQVVSIEEVQLWPKDWGLGRITWRHPKSYKKFIYPEVAGKDVDVYVVDTGCQPSHPEFEGRARIGASFVGEDGIDKNGHGTHVSGTIAGKTTGVAKKANIICVQVLNANGSGSWAGVVSGINFVAEQAKKSGKKSAANMSLGGGKSDIVNKAVTSAVESGVTFVVAAGNSDADACTFSPASTPEAITVAATTSKDARASFSNWGKCVDVFAPGQDIYSTWLDGGYKSISGTSMASPHACGVAALYLSQGLKTPQEVHAKMTKKATKDAITDPKLTANLMIYSQAMMPKKPKSELAEDENGDYADDE